MFIKTTNSNLRTILLISALDQISITIGFPLLTFLCFDTQSSLFAANVSHAVRSFWFGIFNGAPHFMMIFIVPVIGLLSDKYGRKKFLVLGAFGALFLSLATIVSIFYSSLILLFIGMLLGASFARTEPVALAAMGDISQPPQKLINMGYLQFAISSGALIGPIIGGWFAKRLFFTTLNFSLPFFIAAAIALGTIITTQVKFKETFPPMHRHQSMFSFAWQELLNPTIAKISLVLILTQISWRNYYIFMPPILKTTFHATPTYVGLFLALIAFWLGLATTLLLKFLHKYFGVVQMLNYAILTLFIGLGMTIFGCELTNNTVSQVLIWLSTAPVAMGDVVAFCAINTLYSEIARQSHQGKIMGLCVTLSSFVWAFVALTGGALGAIDVKAPLIFAIIALGLWFVLPIKKFVI